MLASASRRRGPICCQPRRCAASRCKSGDESTRANQTDHAPQRALTAYPDAQTQTRTGWVTAQGKRFDQVLDLFYVLLALSVIISVFG
jgi:hypothetical protein